MGRNDILEEKVMRTLAVFVLAYFSLVNECGDITRANNSAQSNINSSEVSAVSTPTPTVRMPPVTDRDRACARGKCRVDTLIDGKLESRSYYRNGQVTRDISYNLSTGKLEAEIGFVYDENGKLVGQKLICGGRFYDDSDDAQLYREHDQKEFDFQYASLRKIGIAFPMPELVSDEVLDLSTILHFFQSHQAAESLPGSDGSQFELKLIDLNEDIMFRSARINSMLGEDSVFVKGLEVYVKDSLPRRETIKAENGSLSIEFIYSEGNLKRIEYHFKANDGKVSRLVKEFVYKPIRVVGLLRTFWTTPAIFRWSNPRRIPVRASGHTQTASPTTPPGP